MLLGHYHSSTLESRVLIQKRIHNTMLEIFIFSIALCIIVLITKRILLRSKLQSLKNKHVVITGGSSGIGKCVAIEAAASGANVTLIARDVKKLESAVSEVKKHCLNHEDQKVQYISLDVSENYDEIEKVLHGAEDEIGPISMLVNCAGMAICGRLEDTSVNDIKYLLNLNFLGTLFPIKAVISRMKGRGEGRIVIVASQAAMLGIYGYTVYSSTKFALRGLAESLHMEVKPYNISVTLSLPPDTDTPGFANEEKSKPMETRLISQSAGIVSPEVVAKQIMKDALTGNFYSTVGSEGFMLTTLCAGMAPVSSVLELITQVSLMGIMRLVSVHYLMSFHRIIRKCMKTRNQTKKSE
ncbi:3-ketodihydrosphingosine reductase isoform X2 [Zootermopsis nevadensis]|uniref:3-ketodihydrosphingosine reductase isoform X2 n=1 Tax=Zootermopsis nevadensis TaxID=136037 RepID=UPI000B8EA81C|nr:3-ketodihydrosphingosine reductase isoform X2 [Zootermopsis nevadensis]